MYLNISESVKKDRQCHWFTQHHFSYGGQMKIFGTLSKAVKLRKVFRNHAGTTIIKNDSGLYSWSDTENDIKRDQ